jgi:hypothetical protein
MSGTTCTRLTLDLVMPSAWRLAGLVVALAALVGVAACGGRAGAAGPVDCGRSDLGHSNYDATGIDCFWQAYSAGKAVVWRIAQVTEEGDPIPGTLSFDPTAGLVASRDVTADKFSRPNDRRMWNWRCRTIERRPWAADPSRAFFELGGCSGDGAATNFP